MSALAGLGVVVIIGALTEAFQAKARRPLVRKWIEERGWTLVSCRYRFDPLKTKWLMTYKIEVLDHTGHPLEGTAYATGFIRRKVWADW